MQNMSQETFNKIITLALLFFFMTMYLVSFVMNRPLDIQALLSSIPLILAHGTHMLYNLTTNKVSVKAASNGTDTNKLKDIKNTLSVPGMIGDTNNASTSNSN